MCGRFKGQLRPTGLRPYFLDKLDDVGIEMSPAMFAPRLEPVVVP